MSIANFLAANPGFEGIDRKAIEDLACKVEERHYRAGQVLIQAGDLEDDMHIIRDGRVKVPILDEQDQEKSSVFLGPGEVVGEMALLTGDARSADVIAETDVTTIRIRRKILKPLLDAYPQLAGFLTEILGQRLDRGGGIEQVGKYRFLGKIGEGSTGKVYAALHPGLNRVVAIKMLSHSLAYHPGFRDRFLQEARTIAELSHPNIVQVFDTESAFATYFIVMEKLSGVDLAQVLAKRSILPPDEAVTILRQIASALAYAHSRGFAHRDVKPANVAFDDRRQIKLMDFGLARSIQAGIRTKSVEGTIRYLAPETALGQPVDGRIDIYALGIMAFEMLTGQHPFEEKTAKDWLEAHAWKEPPDIAELKPEIPEALVTFVRGTLIKDPNKRLCDWPRIQGLLQGGRPAEEFWTRKRERVITIRYTPALSKLVDKASDRLVEELSREGPVEIQQADLQPRAGPSESVVGNIVNERTEEIKEALTDSFSEKDTQPRKD
ncbi:MAG: protein kinase [Deltaproteobacteria bacterium]|nr:protein kinase [Deltaproteobacteria bacterium]